MASGGAWGASEGDAMASTARVRRNRRDGAAAAPVLPEELILWEILVRVPAKELLRCRVVCRSWRRHTSGGAFLLAHHRRQPSLPLVSSNAGDPARPRPSVYAFDLRRSPAARRPVLGFTGHNAVRGFSIHASCDGRLILSVADSRFFVCNPATRQWCALPALAGSDAASLYPAGAEYRVLYWKLADNKRNFVYSILTLSSSSSSQEHRCIGQPVVVSPTMKNVDLSGRESLWEFFESVSESVLSGMPSSRGMMAAVRRCHVFSEGCRGELVLLHGLHAYIPKIAERWN